MKMTSTSPTALALRVTLVCLCVLFAASSTTRAADTDPPQRMTFQGFLTDGNGVPLATNAPKNFDVVFRIFDDQNAGNRLWSEQQTVTVDSGYFSVLLGEGSDEGSESRPALSTLFIGATASDRFVQMTVKGIGSGGSDATILPRLRLLASPYSYLAKHAINAARLVNDNSQQVVTITGTSVGINKSSPSVALDVVGAAKVSGSLVVNGLTNTGVSRLEGDVTVVDKITASRSYASTMNFSLDGSAYATIKSVSGGNNPVINWDAYDWLAYKRAENEYDFRIASASKLRINSDKVIVDAPGGIDGRGTIPKGGIIMWSGATVPDGWALCNGQTVNGVATPNLSGRFILASGSGSGLTARTIGQSGGEEMHTLSVNEMPSHNHPTSVGTVGYAAAWNGSEEATRAPNQGRNNGNQTFPSANKGGGQAHSNMPPYYVLAFIMRVY